MYRIAKTPSRGTDGFPAAASIPSAKNFATRITIRTKLYGGAALSLMVIGILIAFVVSVSRHSSAALSEVYEQVLIPNAALQQVRESFLEIELDMTRVQDRRTPMPEAFRQLSMNRGQLNEAWSRFRKTQEQTTVSEDELAISRNLDRHIAATRPLFEKLGNAYAAQDAALITPMLETDMRAMHGDLINSLEELRAIEQEEAKDISEESIALSQRVSILAAVAIAFSVSSVGGFAIWLNTCIKRSIDKVNRALAEVAAGRLDVQIDVSAPDEIGSMADSLTRTLVIIKADRDSLEALRHRDKSIWNALGEGLFGEDAQGRITFANPAMERMLGWNASELIGKSSEELFEPVAAGDRKRCRLIDALSGEESYSADDQLLLRKDGTTLPVDYTYAAIREDGKTVGAVLAFRDISERKAAQDELLHRYAKLQELNQRLDEARGQLMQSEKMASLGQIAAGIAHEINNPVGYVKSNVKSFTSHVNALLTIISAYERAEPMLATRPEILTAITAAKKAADFEYVREDIEQLLAETTDGIERIAGIVRDLRDFSHPENSKMQMTELHKGLNSTLNIVWNELKYKATIVKEYGTIPEIECVPMLINQVFMNLLVNASHAIEKKGIITLRTRADDHGVFIEVADTGKGIAPEHTTRIFEPFFTTKPVGQGTGLGLSLAYGIIKKHGGTISVQSEVGNGTTFRIWLPLCQNVLLETEETGRRHERK